ncbi:MAG TPA: TonB-dependent receptor [Vicinamibacterales bacterium]|nr:TonB-dependent receptor [Vicinamibacterales bacterium]
MTLRLLGRLLVVLLFLATVPAIAFAQEAVLSGTVTDLTGAVLPGVTITAVHQATGNKFMAVTDERGVYRVAARAGVYTLTAELQGFRAVTREGLELRVGQVMTVNLPMLEATAVETVTVTAESPLLNVATSSLGGNVDPRQIQELPVNGRNWIGLALLAPGSKTLAVNATTPLPDRNGGEAREFQLNMDGQQVSADIGTGGQPRFSQDSIAEFQFLSNRFDATQGRSSGVLVNAITKSGGNRLTGNFRGNFRNSKFNAYNPVLGRVEPIDNQQYSATLGGPLVQDKLHYFVNYEYEREPRTSIWNTPYPEFNVDLEGVNNKKIGGVRLDYQLSTDTRLMGKVSAGRLGEPFGLGNQQHPAATNTTSEHNNEVLGQLSQVLNNHTLNEVKVGYAFFNLENHNLTTWSNHWQSANGITTGSPRITFTGFTIAGNQFHPRHQDQDVWSVRDDFSYSYDAGGRHDMRAGGEFLRRHQIQANCRQCMGTVAANQRGPRPGLPGSLVPTPLPALFPDAFNADTWNLAAISPLVSTYSVGLGDFDVHMVSQKAGLWAQDDWQISSNLTLNLGLRWDGSFNAFANDIALPPFQEAGRPNEIDNIQPRIGFAWKLGERTVVRGGTGLYYGDALGADQSFATGNAQIVVIQYANDGRADFAANPTNGQPLPTYDQALRRFCYNNGNLPGCLIRDLQEFVGPFDYVNLPRTFQASVGFQRQLGDTMSFEADYVYSKGRDEKDVVENINLSYNPATGANNPSSNRALRPYPDWGVVSMNTHLARSGYHALQTGFQKRFADRWQGSATYTVSGLWNADTPPFSGLEPVPFATVPDLGGEWGLSSDDQRHRAVFSGIWEVGRGFQVSALHFFAAGLRLSSSWGADLRQTGAANSQRLRPDGSIIARNSLLAPKQNRTDLRVQQRIRLGGRFSIDGIAEVFNMFNVHNYGIGTVESNLLQYLQPVSAQTRTAQFGFRLMF